MIAALAGALGIDQNVGDVLHIANFARALAHLEQRIEAGRAGIGGIEQQAVRELGPPAGGQLPILALDVVDHGGADPSQQGWHDEANALARPRRRDRQHMLGAVVAQIPLVVEAQHDAFVGKQVGIAHITEIRPAGRAIGCGLLVEAGPPGGSPDGDGAAGDSPEGGNGTGACKHVRSLSVE